MKKYVECISPIVHCIMGKNQGDWSWGQKSKVHQSGETPEGEGWWWTWWWWWWVEGVVLLLSDIGWNLPPCWWKVEKATKPCLGVWWSLKPEPRGQSWLAFPRPRQNQSLWLSYGAMISRIKVFKNVIEKFQQVSSNNSIVIIFFLMAISWHLWQLFHATIRIFWSFRPWQKFLAMIGCQ